ncbi:hypothetical protein MGYG_04565 [Nannizzia gypsea CBS 118893]|uniref:Uncharacterized protein n=1 Tax=Arthroderma gypseum (strain ATCC MYA-4604 / CBS 118893) TaxID=535722 RepID=E4UTS0_ARTGP|nr:hypothetical protein MGYG_04565 [Nannizzia gypsea CBS 118893]EFR01563.1 hypothetical protein MGYG_04565 [Nannizzia gypsea CBS 118893]
MAAKRQAPGDPMATHSVMQPPPQAMPTSVDPANPATPGAPSAPEAPISQPPNIINPLSSTLTIPAQAAPTSQPIPGVGMTSVVSEISPPSGTKHPKATAKYPPTTTPYSQPTEGPQPSHSSLPVNPHASGFSTGLLAGAIAGSVVCSVLLTFVATYFFFSRRRSRGGNNPSDRQTREPLGDKDYDVETASSRRPLNNTLPYSSDTDKKSTVYPHAPQAEQSGLEDYIPSPADDKTVQSRVLTVFDHLALHVENYYTCSSPLPSESGHSTQHVAMLNSYNSPFLPAPVASLLSQPNDREPIIKHCLVQSLMPATFHAAPASSRSEASSFLPPLFTASKDFQDMQPHRDQEAHKVHFYWRMLTAHWYRGAPDTQKQAYLSTRAENISKVVDAFTSAFRPYANPHHPEPERIRHLTKVMEDAADLGIWLFEQPCEFEFAWGNVTAGQVVVSPAVVKVTDEQGTLLPVTKTVVKADIARCI